VKCIGVEAHLVKPSGIGARRAGGGPSIRSMVTACPASEFDVVELTDAVDDAPAGARGGVLELHPNDTAMVEVLGPPLDPAARIIFAPLAKLRVINARP
jgi:hypothetical protein